MLVEKTNERGTVAQLRSVGDFKEAVKQLWDNHVRTELIYGKKLRFCRTCTTFFYQEDPDVDHPPGDTEGVREFLGTAGITSLSRLETMLFSLLRGYYSSIGP
jgi:hypothetical protein